MNVSFDVAPADAFTGGPYDLVTMFDCLHDMGDPIGAARHIREVIAEDGTWMIVEPAAGDDLADAVVAGAARRHGARDAGRPGPHQGRGDRGRVRRIPGGRADAVQQCLRGAALNSPERATIGG